MTRCLEAGAPGTFAALLAKPRCPKWIIRVGLVGCQSLPVSPNIGTSDVIRLTSACLKTASTEVHIRKPHHSAFAPSPTLVPLQDNPFVVCSRRTRFH